MLYVRGAPLVTVHVIVDGSPGATVEGVAREFATLGGATTMPPVTVMEGPAGSMMLPSCHPLESWSYKRRCPSRRGSYSRFGSRRQSTFRNLGRAGVVTQWKLISPWLIQVHAVVRRCRTVGHRP